MRISVFITSYNQNAYLVEAIESVLLQTLRPSQIIIVDDFSTDSSGETIAGYSRRYPELITPIYHTQNQGVAQTRIDALNAVTGDYVTYVDGDDRYLPTKLEREAALLRSRPNAQVIFSNYYYMTGQGEHTGLWADKETPPEGDVFRQTFAREFPRSTLFRHELVDYRAWKQIGFFDRDLRVYEDYEMRIRLTRHLQTAYVAEPLSEYRLHEAGLSRARASEQLTALEYIYRKNEALLDSLSSAERKDVERRLRSWLARVATSAAGQELRAGQLRRALGYSVRALKYAPDYLEYGRFILGHLLRRGSHPSTRSQSSS